MPHMLFTIILFFIITYGLGYNLTRFLRKNNNLETHIMRIGIGLGAFPVLGLLLNFLKIPLDWRIFLAIALAGISFDCLRLRQKDLKFAINFAKPSKHIICLFLIFAVSVFIYCKGPFNYPWLEDDDSWSHAAGIKYIAVERNINVPSGEFHYINPYPPGYDLTFGILHQTNPSLYWTLKFFNGFLVALGFLFFYFFTKEFSRNENKALWATFFLACIPCYLSHFIWAHSLAVTLFFPALYTFHKAQNDRRFILPGSIVIAGIFLTQPTQSIKFCILVFILSAAILWITKKLNKNLIITVGLAGMISLLWWGPVIKEMKTGTSKIAVRHERSVSGHTEDTPLIARGLFDPRGGTATRSYSWRDYFITSERNMINNPLGVGPTLSILALLGILACLYRIRGGSKEDKIYYITTIGWLIFTFLGMNSQTFHLPVGLFAFRFWMLFAIPVSLLATEAVFCFLEILKRPAIKIVVLACFISGVLFQSGYAKYNINTGAWPWGVYWRSYQELMGYVWLRKNLKPNTKVFTFTDNLFVVGHDMHADYWSEKYKKSFKDAIKMDIAQLHAALKRNHFEYIILERRGANEFGLETINEKIKLIAESNLFEFVHEAKGMRIYKVI